MANELKLSVTLAYKDGLLNESLNVSDSINVATAAVDRHTITVPTTDTALSLSADIASLGYVFVQNLDATNFIQIGNASTDYTVKMLPGEFAIFRAATTTLHAEADTAAVDLFILALPV